ncbi:MAG: hypothetical protein IKJ01_01990 [Lachnospiraceae bacterium]|nr:hypothetical protein [Lachnospiraceae bacterium]
MLPNENMNTAYDDVFRTILNDCPELIIPLVNEIFQTNYSTEEKVILYNNEFFLTQQQGEQIKRITDSNFEIRNTQYHLECQSTQDGTMVIRIFEYDTQIALKNSKLEDGELTVYFPRTAVLYLRHNKQTPDYLQITIHVPGDSCSYKIPTLKVKQYTIEEIFEKELLFLIPFHIFVYEKQFKLYDNNEEKLEQLKKVYIDIRNRLEVCVKKEQITEYIKSTIIDMSEKVLRQIARNYSNVEKGIGDVMGGKILEYEAKTILNQGRIQGIEEGTVKGKLLEFLQTVENLQKNLKLSLEDALKAMGKTMEDYENAKRVVK